MNRTAAWILIALLIPLHAFSLEKIIWNVAEHQPDLAQGGRANAVAVHPANGDELFVASDGGGLFKSTDRGLHWTHVDTLPVFFTQAVAYVDSNVVLVSAKADFKTDNGGGVWRSDDGGATWTQRPLPGPTGRLSAYEISVSAPNAVVGTSKGVFVSTDGGVSWTHEDPFGGSGEVFSVLLMPGNPSRIYASGPAGVRLGTIPLGPWVAPASAGIGGVWTVHAFGRSPLSPSHAFLTTGHSVWRTEDSGVNWTLIPAPPNPGGGCDSMPFIKAAARGAFLDLYFGNECKLHRLAVPVDSGGTADFSSVVSGAWQLLGADPSGMRDLALVDAEPVLLATNRGLHNTADQGLQWSYTGGGRDGYSALQVAEIKGQLVQSEAATDLYFATRDNGLWAADAEAADVYPDPRPGEAFFLEAERTVPSPAESRITWKACNPCKTSQSNRHFANETEWAGPDGGTNAPVLLKRHQYMQNVPSGLEWTPDAGTTWHPFASHSEETIGIPTLARPGFGFIPPIVYQAKETRLLRVLGNGMVFHPAMTGFGGLGIRETRFAQYAVYGVRGSTHVIAPDIVNQRMMETTDAGDIWSEMAGLTSLVTDNGKLLFQTEVQDDAGDPLVRAPLVTAVSFSPQDPRLVVIGTQEGGIFVSSNQGQTWSKIAGSEKAPHITSFFWANANTVFLSTYGRGLWKLTNRRIIVADAFDDFCGSCEVVANDGGPGRPPFDGSVLVFEGSILGVRTDNRRLREVFVTPGSSVLFTGDPKDEQEDIVITESNGKDSFEPLPKPPDGWIVTGVVFTTDDVLTGTVFAESEMSLLPPESEKE
jgi:photosystem II stability/assembly factor-like uncharacterized protein